MLASRVCLFLAAAMIVLAALAGSGSAGPLKHATAAKKAPPTIVVRDFRFLGFDKDVVGRGRDARPNGERDAHFSLVVSAPDGSRSALGLIVERCNPGSKCSQGDRDVRTTTSGPQTAAVLGVFRGGKRLNINPRDKKTWLDLPRSAKGIRLDLYVNDGPGCLLGPTAKGTALGCWINKQYDRRFAPGQMFRVLIESVPGPYSSAWLTLPGQAATRSTPAIVLSNLRFHGLDKDVVGRTPGSTPDGQPDGHFSIELATPTGPAYMFGLALVGDPTGGWEAGTGGLAVFLDGTRLKLGAGDPGQCPPKCDPDLQNWVDLRWSTKPVRLDLYAPYEAWGPFAPGRRWRVGIPVQLPSWVPGEESRFTQSAWLTLP